MAIDVMYPCLLQTFYRTCVSVADKFLYSTPVEALQLDWIAFSESCHSTGHHI